MIRNTLGEIILLFESDDGKWTTDQIDHANRQWATLADDAKNFLNTLSNEDLENICIGEYRDELRDDGTLVVMRLYNGEWQTIPPAVDSFLHTIWEYA